MTLTQHTMQTNYPTIRNTSEPNEGNSERIERNASSSLNPPSNHSPLNLLMLLQLIIPPHQHTRKQQTQTAHSSRKLPLLTLPIRPLNPQPRLTPHRITQLLHQILIDKIHIRNLRSGQKPQQILPERPRPDGRANGLPDRPADGREHVLDGEDYRDVLVGCGGHYGDLLGDDEGAAGEGDEDLAHYYVADVDVRLAELDHEAGAEDCDGDAEVEGLGL